MVRLLRQCSKTSVSNSLDLDERRPRCYWGRRRYGGRRRSWDGRWHRRRVELRNRLDVRLKRSQVELVSRDIVCGVLLVQKAKMQLITLASHERRRDSQLSTAPRITHQITRAVCAS